MMAVATLMATMSANAQHREGDNTLQPRVGITMSTLTDAEGSKMKINMAGGLELEHFFTEEFSVAGGALFTKQGTKFDDGTKLNIFYCVIPLTANYYVLPGLAVKAGVQPGYRMKSNVETDEGKIDIDRFLGVLFDEGDIKMPKFDLSIPIGLSYEYSGVTLDVRYNLGLTKVLTGTGESVRNQVIAMTLGYKF